MTGRSIGGVALLAIAAFMLLGFARSDASLGAPSTIFAILLTVGLPAVGGFALLSGKLSIGGGSKRVERLRQQTIDAEILRLATQQKGRLTALEVATTFALSPETAKANLDSLVSREIADLEITDDGVIVYTFHDAKNIEGKHSARGLLDA
jgi:hypothetical protein